MNWRISSAVAALFSSFLFASCEDPTALGLELQGPGSLIGTTFTDTTTVNASTVLLKDSIITLGAARAQVGRVEDANFGVTSAKTYAEIGLSSLNVAFDPNNGADSLVLSLDYDYYFGDTLEVANWNVYRLTEGFTDQTTYFTTTDLDYNQTPIGTVSFTPRPRSTYVTTNPETGDTLTRNNPVLVRIRLDQTAGGMALANEILAQSDKAPLKTQQAFVSSLLKGLVIAPAPNAQNKAVLGVNLGNSQMTLFYTSTTDSKTKSYTFYPTERNFNRIESNRANTPIASLTTNGQALPSSSTNGLTYLQAGTGLVTKLSFPHISDFRKIPTGEPRAGQLRDLAVNKAELIIPIKVENQADTLLLPPIITIVEATASNRIARTNGFPNALPREGTSQFATLEYRGSAHGYVYVANITSYMQNLLYNKRENHGLILLPSNISTSLSTPTNFAQTVNKAILEAMSQTDPNRKIQLRVFYSVAK
ncbi:DUF4270 family protein [Rufibacter roseus]|uniref:DUF4270 family protein n=1 Tax=Rufibacter roseus TaxID=1567108 RepID=A0ABW2DJW7_9BACT|nr:DUF4270 family protein [Rufibacter roseus]